MKKKRTVKVKTGQKITNCLWFDRQALEAAKFYVSIFRKGSKITDVSYYGKEGREVHGMPEGTVLVAEFILRGQTFTALNGGPLFKFNESISLQVHCDDQKELDYFWGRLSKGGDPKAQQCGWLKDKFGVSWQIVPRDMKKWMSGRDPQRAGRVMKAFLPMKKLVIKTLQKAYEGS